MAKEIEVSISEAIEILRTEWAAEDSATVILSSHSGIGKTTMLEQLAVEEGFKYGTLRAALYDGVEINGFPVPENGRVKYNAPPWVPDWDEKFVLIVDELNRGRRDVVQAIFRVMEGRGTDSWKFNPKKHKIVVAINPVGVYQVDPLGLATINRAIVLYIKPDIKAFLTYAHKIGLDTRVIQFLAANDKYLHLLPKEEEQEFDTPWTSPREWETVSKVIKRHNTKFFPALIAGSIGVESCAAFMKFINDPDRPVTAQEIMEDKYDTKLQDKFIRHQDKSIHKAFATVLDLTSKLNTMDVKKIKLDVIKKFYATIDKEEIKTAFIKGIDQDEQKRFDDIAKGLDISKDLLNIADTFNELKKKTQ